MAEKWITTRQAAELSGYNLRYLLRLLQSGKLKGRRFGWGWQVNRASLLAYARRSAGKSPEKKPK